jgi:hypothetical protein
MKLIKIFVSGICIALSAVTVSCTSTDSLGQYPDGPKINTLEQSTGLVPTTHVFSAEFDESGGPYQVHWDFGGGLTPNTIDVLQEAAPVSASATTSQASGTFTATVIVTDIQGRSQTAEITYTY